MLPGAGGLSRAEKYLQIRSVEEQQVALELQSLASSPCASGAWEPPAALGRSDVNSKTLENNTDVFFTLFAQLVNFE